MARHDCVSEAFYFVCVPIYSRVCRWVRCVWYFFLFFFLLFILTGIQLWDRQLQAAVWGPPVSRQLCQLLDQLCGAQTPRTHPARPSLSLDCCRHAEWGVLWLFLKDGKSHWIIFLSIYCSSVCIPTQFCRIQLPLPRSCLVCLMPKIFSE